MIFLPIKAGFYQIQDDDKIIAYIQKQYKQINGKTFHIGYQLTTKDGRIEFFKNLNKIHEKYNFQNFPGYGRILEKK